MLGVTIKRTIQQIRDALRQQKEIGTYRATERELPFGTWVWLTKYLANSGDTNILGAIIEIKKYRSGGSRYDKGQMVRRYVVLTTHGQFEAAREDLVVATADEVRGAAGLTPQLDLQETIFEALAFGPSDANTLRAEEAIKALSRDGKVRWYSPRYPGACTCEQCIEWGWVNARYLPRVVLTGKWSD